MTFNIFSVLHFALLTRSFTYFSFDFFFSDLKVRDAVESLSTQILTIQATGDKNAANLLLQKYCIITNPLQLALDKLESIEVCPFNILSTGSFIDD